MCSHRTLLSSLNQTFPRIRSTLPIGLPDWRFFSFPGYPFTRTNSTFERVSFFLVQGQHDFQKGLAPLRSPQSEVDQHEIENECLGMAVLAITHDSMNREIPLTTTNTNEIR